PVPPALAENGCTACHGVTNRIIGPGFNEVTAKYKGKPGLEAYFNGKIKRGGEGIWGTMPMPPQDHVKEADVRAIAAWLAAAANQ
ncbi:MAG: c-type cytochrome, partial [Pseudomonadota bacterium]|nr:c-type cytochrome [Pseudomonadota bacterium]